HVSPTRANVRFSGFACSAPRTAIPGFCPACAPMSFGDNLSQAINRAAYGTEPLLVTRRGTKIEAIISIVDFAFLKTMKQRREATMAEKHRRTRLAHAIHHSYYGHTCPTSSRTPRSGSRASQF